MMHDHGSSSALSADVVLAIPFVFALVLYGSGVVILRRRALRWPWWRSVAWAAGIVAASAGFIGPLAAAAHEDFVAHMGAHLLVGMAAPLLLVVAAPVTLALRTLHVSRARRLSRMLRSWPARIVTAPVEAALLNVGGMWMLYATPLYEAMQNDPLLHLAVMTHFLVAGYLFTAAIIPIDPAPHRAGYPLRMAVVVIALAAHGILAKSLYGYPPAGVSVAEAQAGSMLMYYWGDLIDVAIITILCAQWYRHAGRRLGVAPALAQLET
jgi:putative membrane protein